MVQAEPDTVNYLGSADTKFAVVLATTTTSAKGTLSVTLKAPVDFGGLHDIYAVIKGEQDAHGGFILLRTVTVSPRSGPIGTPITITYSGLGASLYTGGAALLWDNHYVGELMANWTRGTARVTIRAAGPVGKHTIQIGNAISYLYLNVPQSPIPYTNGATVTFTVTRDDGPPPASIDWPVDVAPTLSARTTLITSGGLGATSPVKATLTRTRGPVETRVAISASGLSNSARVQLVWSTVVGNRVNCKSTCWVFVSQTLGSAMPSSGGSLRTKLTVPDSLGGWHVVQLVQGHKVLAQVPFYVEESIVGKGVSSIVVKEGQPFTIHLEGVGWTQLDNTVAVDYDNSYIGYGCGFNSNGDVLLNLHATGGPGTHLIDLYPMLYTLSPSFADTPYGMVPVLTYARDEPALALGYHLPATQVRDHRREVARRRRVRKIGLASQFVRRGEASTRASRAIGTGNHQFQRPSSVIRLGMSRPRTMVASSRTPSASPAPSSCKPATRPSYEPGQRADHDQRRRADNPSRMHEPIAHGTPVVGPVRPRTPASE